MSDFPILNSSKFCLDTLLIQDSDYADQVWIWENEEGSSFYFDVGEVVRFRVEAEEWHDQIPNAPELVDGPTSDRKSPYAIIVCLSQAGIETSISTICLHILI